MELKGLYIRNTSNSRVNRTIYEWHGPGPSRIRSYFRSMSRLELYSFYHISIGTKLIKLVAR